MPQRAARETDPILPITQRKMGNVKDGEGRRKRVLVVGAGAAGELHTYIHMYFALREGVLLGRKEYIYTYLHEREANKRRT